eukprot:scaffold37530_cov18-Tisochrysis_lutea.AAC.2
MQVHVLDCANSWATLLNPCRIADLHATVAKNANLNRDLMAMNQELIATNQQLLRAVPDFLALSQ